VRRPRVEEYEWSYRGDISLKMWEGEEEIGSMLQGEEV
jgi:hypothetical protein